MHLPLPLLPLLLILLSFTLACTPTCTTPTPTRAFTVAAFESPWPPGSNNTLSHGVSGLVMRAQGGAFWFNSDPDTNRPNTACPNNYTTGCPPGNQTVLWVDRYGQAWLDSETPQQIFLDTQTGALSYLTSLSTPPNTFTPGALITNFLHLGQGTSVTSPIPGENPALIDNAGTGTFQWIGSDNSYWFLCPRPGPGYQVLKYVGGYEDWDLCLSGIQLVALDYEGVSPAAWEYL